MQVRLATSGMLKNDSPILALIEQSKRSLSVVLRPRLTLALIEGHPGDQLMLDEVTYRDTGYGDWTGFYDWLRDSNDRVLGLRYWPDDTTFLLDVVRGFPYVVVPQNNFYMEIYFSTNRDVDLEKSGDQDFLYDKVFASDTGEYLICFDTSLLSDSQVKEIVHTTEAIWLS